MSWLLLFQMAHAAPKLGLQYAAGVSGFIGDLSESQGRLTQEVYVNTLFVENRNTTLSGHLSMGMLTTNTHHDGDAFPFQPDTELKVLGFLFLAHLCAHPVDRLRGCLALGEGTVNVNESDNRRDYGTWNYATQAGFMLTERVSVVATGRLIGSIEQRFAGVDSAFSMWTATAELDWTR
jgi:hypothetical protein